MLSSLICFQVRYTDGRTWVKHSDGTNMRTTANGDYLLIDAPGYVDPCRLSSEVRDMFLTSSHSDPKIVVVRVLSLPPRLTTWRLNMQKVSPARKVLRARCCFFI